MDDKFKVGEFSYWRFRGKKTPYTKSFVATKLSNGLFKLTDAGLGRARKEIFVDPNEVEVM